ncbi:9-O-acetylesterase [Mucilaginibacter sp. UR6-1]|uniref:sialate O-acetylesterase n=1 Tax=Mucilaginibacter sp. UR6-1 TaxID=1435643 RepID=UPI001E2DF190|nr:sialate O-acetylesterase [Mucilaginibacter sp. UR6-1]MCC8409369.1 9-O-acetylesterase [Mucilaginibacter sp. UR6-1]
MKNKLIIALALLFPAIVCQAKVVLPGCFTDDMVLQQKSNVNLWGKANVGKNLVITTSWNKKSYTIKPDAGGNWTAKIATPAYGGPYTITFNDGEQTELKNILIGEVWVCSGQSNMEMTPTAMYGDILNFQQEKAAANYPQIRMLKIENVTNIKPQTELKTRGAWQICTPESFPKFSTVAYFFARNLYESKHIPIGIINTTWGGTIAEAWTSGDALKQMPAFQKPVADMENSPDEKELLARYEGELKQWMGLIDKKDPSYSNGKLPWIENAYNDAAWKTIKVPGFWETAGLPNFDGVIGFRKVINVPAAWAGKDLVLNLGALDDIDVTWFNGTEVGHNEVFYANRSYTIPGKLVKAGPNVIAVRIFDTGGNGGFDNKPVSIAPVGDVAAAIDLAGEWKYNIINKMSDMPPMPYRPDGPNRPTVLYNAMVSPIINYTIKGAIWYQGESNADRAYQYRTLFPLMINNWRAKWGQGNFPFYFVQLAAFMPKDNAPVESAWAELREAQLMTLKQPNTGMAVTIDIGDAANIHPANKQEVGRRLALIARAKNYGEKITYAGPAYTSVKANGKTMELTFSNAVGLKVKGDKPTGFAIAGADKKFYWADAKLQGNKVIVSSAQVTAPVAVRYGWGNNPDCNLYNADDLPASPFRTDDWQGITFGKE